MANGEPPRPGADNGARPGVLERLFHLRERSTTVGTEAHA